MGNPVLITLLVALSFAAVVIGTLEMRLRPMVAVVAKAQTQNVVTALLEHTVMEDLARRELGYSDLITLQRDEGGNIIALTTDTAAMNLLRAQLIEEILSAVNELDVSTIRIPAGSLLNFELLWARGPSMAVKSMRVGTISAEFESEFASAGVNQTIHRIWLEVSAPMTVLLPLGAVDVPVQTRLCLAETVIVGQVPDTYLQFAPTSSSGHIENAPENNS
jgi:sporulation protein YunB